MIHDHNVEASLISCALQEPSYLMEILDITGAEAFHNEKYRVAFECIVALRDKQEQVNLVTVCDAVKQRRMNLDIEIMDVMRDHPVHLQDPQAQARILQALSDRRNIHTAGLEMMRMSGDMGEDVLDIREASEKLIFALRRSGSISSVRDIPSVLASILEGYTNAQELARLGKVTGVTSGIRDIDKLTLGWQPAKLMILAARPGVGKTALAVGFAFDAGIPVLAFSMEMDAEELVERRLMPDAGVSAYKAKSGHLKDADWDAINSASEKLGSSKVFIDDRPGLTIQQIKSTARRMVVKQNVGLIMVDYMQLAYGSGGNKNTNREQEVASISRGLKELAKELKVPVIGLSQLNRTKKHDERPDINGERNPILNWCFDKHRGGALGGGKLVYVPNSAKIVPYYEDEQKERYNGKLPF